MLCPSKCEGDKILSIPINVGSRKWLSVVVLYVSTMAMMMSYRALANILQRRNVLRAAHSICEKSITSAS